MKILLISVGGSPEPIIYSINQSQPDKLVLFCSAESRESFVNDVRPKLINPLIDCETIFAPDIQDLVACVRALHVGVPEKLKLFKSTYEELLVDYTGGTKTMSAAMVMALCDKVGTFIYVGGERRNKDGLGTVEPGWANVLHQKNPWDELAVETLKNMSVLFNRCRFQSTKEMARNAAGRSIKMKPFFQAIEAASDAFYKWDNLQYSKAKEMLKQAESKMGTIGAASYDPNINSFKDSLSLSIPVLENICREMEQLTQKTSVLQNDAHLTGNAIVVDLISNAIRRAEVEHKYDDAVARLYSAIEKYAKLRLKTVYQIDNSNVDLSKIHEVAFRDMLAKEFSGERDGKAVIQVPLHKSFELLKVLGDKVGSAYDAQKNELIKVLNIRNMSLLAHGFASVAENTYTDMLKIALAFIGIQKDQIPKFPRMKWEDN